MMIEKVATLASEMVDIVLDTMQPGLGAITKLGNEFWFAQGQVLKTDRWKGDTFAQPVLKTRDEYYERLRLQEDVADAWSIGSIRSYSITAENIRKAYPDITLEQFSSAFMNLHKSKGSKMLKTLVAENRTADLEQVLPQAIACEGEKAFKDAIEDIREDLGLLPKEKETEPEVNELTPESLCHDDLMVATGLYIQEIHKRLEGIELRLDAADDVLSSTDKITLLRMAELVTKVDRVIGEEKDDFYLKDTNVREAVAEMISENGVAVA